MPLTAASSVGIRAVPFVNLAPGKVIWDEGNE